MKIGVITHWDSLDNYGQQLQCYALQHYLRSQGHEAFLIKYLPEGRKEPKRPLWRRVAGTVKWRFFVPQAVKDELSRLRQARLDNKQLNPQRNFEGFRNDCIASTAIVYRSIGQLRTLPPQADAYITGSDQVWHDALDDPSSAGPYLDFGPSETKRISYAASIGRDLENHELSLFTHYLGRFDAISVREQKACDLCHSVGFKDAVVTIDPTLLLDAAEYRKMMPAKGGHPTAAKPYAFFYLLNIYKAEEVYWNYFEKKITEEGLDVKAVASTGYLPAQEFLPGHRNLLATIPEWLSLIDRAQYVVTSSFHGVVFCLLLHRPFYAVLLKNEFATANDRIFSLLQMAGLEDRAISREEDIERCENTEIVWEAVDARLAQTRNHSVDFLRRALKE